MFDRAREVNSQVDQWFRSRPKFRWLVLAVAHGGVYAALAVLISGSSLLWGVSLGIVGGIAFATVYTGLGRLTDD